MARLSETIKKFWRHCRKTEAIKWKERANKKRGIKLSDYVTMMELWWSCPMKKASESIKHRPLHSLIQRDNSNSEAKTTWTDL